MPEKPVNGSVFNRFTQRIVIFARCRTHEELTPMTDEQWQKAKRLTNVLSNRFAYHTDGAGRETKREAEFVKNFIQLPYDAPLTRRQSQLLERIWVKYRRFHCDILATPRWIQDYEHERWRIGNSTPYEFTEIGFFNNNHADEPYDCDPYNKQFTITFKDGDLW